MGKLISRGELIRRLNVLYDTTTLQRTDEITKAFLDFRFLIMNVPTVEAKEVVYGEWKYYRKKGIAVCKNCSFERKLDDDFGRAIACPNCGCRMEE